MPTEKPVVQPLSGEEVREAILFKISESLRKTCHLNDSAAYTAFFADISIKLRLVDYGREVTDNHVVQESVDVRPPDEPGREQGYEVHLEVPPAPPNQVRVETGQGVPVNTVVGGKVEQKKVRYAPRKASTE